MASKSKTQFQLPRKFIKSPRDHGQTLQSLPLPPTPQSCAIPAFVGLSPQAQSLTHLLPIFLPPLSPFPLPLPLSIPSSLLPICAHFSSSHLWLSSFSCDLPWILSVFFLICSPDQHNTAPELEDVNTNFHKRAGSVDRKGGGCEYTHVNIFVPVTLSLFPRHLALPLAPIRFSVNDPWTSERLWGFTLMCHQSCLWVPPLLNRGWHIYSFCLINQWDLPVTFGLLLMLQAEVPGSL